MPIGGIAFDDEVFTFDITQAAQLGEKRAHAVPPPVSVRRVVGIAGWKIAIRCLVARCCARADHGRAASNIPAVNSRRLIGSPCRPGLSRCTYGLNVSNIGSLSYELSDDYRLEFGDGALTLYFTLPFRSPLMRSS